MDIALMFNKSDNRMVAKNLATYSLFNARAVGQLDVEHPQFEISEDIVDTYVATCNYCFIPDFGRYYYCKVVLLTGRKVRVDCFKCDVLQSFASQILSCKGIVARNENIQSSYLVDSDIKPSTQRKYTQYNFDASPFSIENMASGTRCICLTVSGGN